MPITFGSFGDVATVLQLAWQLRAALSDASGASAEIRALIIDVDSFTRALQQTKAAVEKRRMPLAPAVENGIKHAIIACHDALRLILRKIDAFQERMTTRIGVAAWRQYWAVAAWSILGGKKDVDALRVRLSEQIAVVQTYLSLAQSNDQAKIQETVESQGVALDRLYSVMQDIQIRFDVDVPSFHFCNRSIGYYAPFARTSFQRLEELSLCMPCIGLPRLNVATNQLIDVNKPDHILPVRGPFVIEVMLYAVSKHTRKRHLPREHVSLVIDLCFFKERAFNQWQVLLGSSDVGRSLDIDVVKLLVERPHPVGSRCRCTDGMCRNRQKEVTKQANHWKPFQHAMALTYQIEHLGTYWNDNRGFIHGQACSEIRGEIRSCSADLAFIHSTVVPLLQLHAECQHPSLSKIKSLCQSASHKGRPYSTQIVHAAPSAVPAELGRQHNVGPKLTFREYIPFGHTIDWL